MPEDYKESIQIKITGGPTRGTKSIVIRPKMDVLWNVRPAWDTVGIFYRNSQHANSRRS
ncbi:MAG: hypothetical protein M3Y53_01485 [Thermoproteota archaeon]|nr:hypothetical protein [Thermoproteota archaeon]